MKIRIVSLLLAVIVVSFSLFGCTDNTNDNDRQIINDGVIEIGCLLPEEGDVSQQLKDGFLFANSLADSVNLNDDSISVNYTISYYSEFNDISSEAESLVANGVAAVVCYTEDYEEYKAFSSEMYESGIPAVSLSPFPSEQDNIFSLTSGISYASSASATYAMEKGYGKCAVLCETGDKYYSDFAETFKATYKSYIGAEPTVYYKSGDLANYSPAALVGGNYDYVFMICSDFSCKQLTSELRDNGFTGEIMFTEVLDNHLFEDYAFDNCSYLTKLNEDASNNISTVFYSMYSEYAGVKPADVTAAVAYGYDSYMTVFEAIKSFSVDNENVIFGNADTQAASSVNADSIMLSDLTDAIENVIYYGVTDTVRFKNNQSITTVIYVNSISDGKAKLGGKYTFAPENINNN